MSRRVFRGLRTLRNKSTLDSIFSSWSTSSLGWVLFFFNVKEREFKISFSPVYCCFGQILVHVGALLLRRLLHHSALFCINILGQDMDRWEHVDFATNGIHPSILIKWTIWNFTLESKVFSQDSGSCELCGWWQFRTSCSTSTSSRPPPPSGKLLLENPATTLPWTHCTVVALALTIVYTDILVQLWPKRYPCTIKVHRCNPCDPHIKRDVSLAVTQIEGGTAEGVWGAHQQFDPKPRNSSFEDRKLSFSSWTMVSMPWTSHPLPWYPWTFDPTLQFSSLSLL